MKSVIAAIAGLIVAFIVVGGITAISHVVYPPPPGINMEKPETICEHIHEIEMMSMVFVIFAHFVGILAGNLVARLITKGNKAPGLAIGGLMIVATIVNLFMIPCHPTWFMVADIITVLVAALIGMKIAGKKKVQS